MLNPPQLLLLQSLVDTARADGHIAEAERSFIRSALCVLGVSDEDRARVEAALDGTAELPALPADTPRPDYATRLKVFTQSVALALADGVLDADERSVLDRLTETFGLHQLDEDAAWGAPPG